MKMRLAAITAFVVLYAGTPASAHRLDEYLQATTISLEKECVGVRVCLTPGVDVFQAVLAEIDTDGDGVISEAERQAYAGRVVRDLSLTVDGKRLPLRPVSSTFGSIDEMKEGLGEIVLEYSAEVPPGDPNRRLVFENHHQSRIAAYMVNCLLPDDPGIRVTGQSRDYEQSFYQLDYVQAGVRRSRPTPAPVSASSSSFRLFLGADAVILFGWLAFLWRRRAGAAERAASSGI